MTAPDSMRLLYSHCGRVRRGYLTRHEGGVVLTTAGGSEVPASPGIVLLVPPDLTDPETALLTRATESGYRAERP